MKFKNIIYIIILLFITLIGMWAIPALVNKATYNSDQYNPKRYWLNRLQKQKVSDGRFEGEQI